MSATARQFGEGPLSRFVSLIYTLLAVEVLFVVTAVPGLVPLVVLDRDASNIPLAVACAIPLGPALSAAIYAMRRRSRDITDLTPARAFWRGYRLNVWGTLRIWLPYLAWMTIIAVNLGHFGAAGVPGWWAVVLVVVAIGSTLWVVNALLICSLFTFRTIDTARLAGYFLARTPAATLGNAGIIVVAAVVTAVTSEAVLALFGSLLVFALLNTGRPLLHRVETEFTA
jgi:uncharacterized membrane protein YesL